MLDNGRDRESDAAFSPPPALDETIRVVVCTSSSADEIDGWVQRAIGEYSSATDELHVSHSVAPNAQSGQMVYSALVVLRPGGGCDDPGGSRQRL